MALGRLLRSALVLGAPAAVPHPQLCVLAAGAGIEGADDAIPLRIAGLNIPGDVMGKYPHLYGATHLEIEQQHLGKVRQRQWQPVL